MLTIPSLHFLAYEIPAPYIFNLWLPDLDCFRIIKKVRPLDIAVASSPSDGSNRRLFNEQRLLLQDDDSTEDSRELQSYNRTERATHTLHILQKRRGFFAETRIARAKQLEELLPAMPVAVIRHC